MSVPQTLLLERLKYVDRNTNYLVYGYIHETERKRRLNIPHLVTSICMLYYYVFEHFTHHGDGIQLNDNQTIATVVKIFTRGKKTVYGNFKIESSLNSICIWTFKLLHVSPESNDGNIENIYIGIDSSGKTSTEHDFSEGDPEDYKYFAWGSDQAVWFNGDFTDYGDAFNNNDIIKMELNTNDKSLKYDLNGESQGTAFNNLFSTDMDKFYNLAIALDTKDTQIQLLEFEVNPILP